MVNNSGATFASLIDLAAEAVGGVALACSDDFFAPKERLLKEGRGEFDPDAYTDRGKLMDGWESRRSRRVRGYDWCILRLGLPGVVRAVDIDTNHFLGNHPPYAGLDALAWGEGDPGPDAPWEEILAPSVLRPGSQNLFALGETRRVTHLRLRIYPDGGVARLKVYGEVRPDWEALRAWGAVDLAAVSMGGLVAGCSDQFFGSMHNLLMPGKAANMGGGWETRRRRGPGHDWVIVKLGQPGSLDVVEVDTHHFKGNFPESCVLEGIYAPRSATTDLIDPDTRWTEIVGQTRLQADHNHRIEGLGARGPFSHVRLSVFPDGGVSRLRLFGRPEAWLGDGENT